MDSAMLRRDEILCCFMVNEAQSKSNSDQSDWIHLLKSIGSVLLNFRSVETLPKRVRLALSIATVGSQNCKQFPSVFQLMCDWEHLNGPIWIIQEELLRHAVLHLMREELIFEFYSTTLHDKLVEVKAKIASTLLPVVLPECVTHEEVIKKVGLLRVEMLGLMDLLISSNNVEEVFNTYAVQFPLTSFVDWYITWGREVLAATTSSSEYLFSNVYDDASLFSTVAKMIAQGDDAGRPVIETKPRAKGTGAKPKAKNSTPVSHSIEATEGTRMEPKVVESAESDQSARLNSSPIRTSLSLSPENMEIQTQAGEGSFSNMATKETHAPSIDKGNHQQIVGENPQQAPPNSEAMEIQVATVSTSPSPKKSPMLSQSLRTEEHLTAERSLEIGTIPPQVSHDPPAILSLSTSPGSSRLAAGTCRSSKKGGDRVEEVTEARVQSNSFHDVIWRYFEVDEQDI